MWDCTALNRGAISQYRRSLVGQLADEALEVRLSKESDQDNCLRCFPDFAPRPVFALCEMLFPGKGAELSNAWRDRVSRVHVVAIDVAALYRFLAGHGRFSYLRSEVEQD
jgi:hypothetical protein